MAQKFCGPLQFAFRDNIFPANRLVTAVIRDDCRLRGEIMVDKMFAVSIKTTKFTKS